MDNVQYGNFNELRQNYYIAGRMLAVNQLFAISGINLGYAVELSLKFILAYNNYPRNKLLHHDITQLYAEVVGKNLIPELRASDDFITLIDERLNSRYPSMIGQNVERHTKDGGVYAFAMDTLHCYDDFILQLDDAIVAMTADARTSIGFRSCRELQSVRGRVFFHCNDHAHARIATYREMLSSLRDAGDNFEAVSALLERADRLWNFPGLMAYRPGGPRENWQAASEYQFLKFEGRPLMLKAPQWSSNVPEGMFFANAIFTLPPGNYRVKAGQVSQQDGEG